MSGGKFGNEKFDCTPEFSQPGSTELVVHGHNCEKAPHTFKLGYLHSEDDDTSYDVDGVTYCGRCHTFLDLQGA